MLQYGSMLLKRAFMATMLVGLSVSSVQADDHVAMLDGAKMHADKTIVENASNADSLSRQ